MHQKLRKIIYGREWYQCTIARKPNGLSASVIPKGATWMMQEGVEYISVMDKAALYSAADSMDAEFFKAQKQVEIAFEILNSLKEIGSYKEDTWAADFADEALKRLSEA